MPCPDPFYWLIYLISVGCAKSAITLADNSQLPPSLKNCPGENGSCFPLPSTPTSPPPLCPARARSLPVLQFCALDLLPEMRLHLVCS